VSVFGRCLFGYDLEQALGPAWAAWSFLRWPVLTLQRRRSGRQSLLLAGLKQWPGGVSSQFTPWIILSSLFVESLNKRANLLPSLRVTPHQVPRALFVLHLSLVDLATDRRQVVRTRSVASWLPDSLSWTWRLIVAVSFVRLKVELRLLP